MIQSTPNQHKLSHVLSWFNPFLFLCHFFLNIFLYLAQASLKKKSYNSRRMSSFILFLVLLMLSPRNTLCLKLSLPFPSFSFLFLRFHLLWESFLSRPGATRITSWSSLQSMSWAPSAFFYNNIYYIILKWFGSLSVSPFRLKVR